MSTDTLGCVTSTLESEELIYITNSSVSSKSPSKLIEILTQRLRLIEESGKKVT